MTSLEEIRKPVNEPLAKFEKHFRQAMKSDVPLLNIITRYILKRKGKQMRPMFVFLSAELAGGITPRTYTAASLIELLHTATLVHDDVVDDSNERRGFFSINALWKNKVAVLVGDYLLSRGLLLALEDESYDLLKIVSQATREMSEGELLQIEKARRLDVDEKVYFEIIRKKTASLIASCCAAGAASAGTTADMTEQFRLFGEKVGIAFQIKDDLFDYEAGNHTGKPYGTDIKEKKMTLPLIWFLNQASLAEKRRVIRIVKHKASDREKVREVIDMVNHSGGLEYARGKMLEYHDAALEILNRFPASPARSALHKLVDFTIERKK
ncbi:MAG: polyprenyl synthetase family protein [Bacteroidales bacterium]